MMTKNEYLFFYNNAPQNIFKGEGISMAIIGKGTNVDFDITKNVYNKYQTEIGDLIKKGYIELTEGAMDEDDMEPQITIDITPKGFTVLKSAQKKYKVMA